MKKQDYNLEERRKNMRRLEHAADVCHGMDGNPCADCRGRKSCATWCEVGRKWAKSALAELRHEIPLHLDHLAREWAPYSAKHRHLREEHLLDRIGDAVRMPREEGESIDT